MKEKKVLQSSFEGELVKYYDRFFLQELRLSREVQYINSLLQNYALHQCYNILDVGCGTGAHDELLAKMKYQVQGIDVSKDMISYAKKERVHPNLRFDVQDIRKYNLDKRFDACISLSHVIGYQLQNQEVEGMLANINRSLVEGGLFIFNFYHLSGILSNGLSPQRKEVTCENGRILRFSSAELDTLESNLRLSYYYFIDDLTENKSIELEISEKIRCFTLNEINQFLKYCGFKILGCFEHMELQDIKKTTWNGCVICQKCV